MRTRLSSRSVPGWVSAPLAGGAFLWLMREEQRRPLRAPTAPKPRRVAQNLVFAAAGAVTLSILQRPAVEPLARLMEKKRWGLARLPPIAGVPLSIALLDYSLYGWHILTHRVPLLWRFHVVHHADVDLDASTALRFHFGELAISAGYRAAQVSVLGISPLALSLWQTLLILSILFHHSNVRLDAGLESQLERFIVTPRLHGIHHTASVVDTNSNWSSGFTLWDRLHGTLRSNRPGIPIGAPLVRGVLA